MKKTSTKLKDMLNEHYILGELPSSKLMKMKWNPVTGKTVNEEGETEEPIEEPITEATKPITTTFVKGWEKMVSFLQDKMEEYKKNPTIKKNNQLFGMANGAYNNMNTVKGIPAQWLKIDKMIGEGKLSEGTLSEGKLVEMYKETISESFVVIDPRGNARPVGSKMQGDRYVKGKKGHYVILAKHALKARRAIEKAGGRASAKMSDLMFDLRYEGKLDEMTDHAFSLNEGFATWKMQFAPMKLSGVSLDPKKTYTVKARSTVEAIKKAAKQAGLSGDAWMATQTHKLVKVG